MKQHQITLASKAEDLHILATELEGFCHRIGLPDAILFKLNLVLDELVTNAINYGFSGRSDGVIKIYLEQLDDVLSVHIQDNGAPFDPMQIPPPDLESDLDERQIGGLGLHFVREIMSQIHYQQIDGENHLTMNMNTAL